VALGRPSSIAPLWMSWSRSFARILGDRTRDGIVKASVQHAKIIGADGRVDRQGQLGDRLTDVAIIVHDL
jgi:hypothetical protein